MKIHRDFTIQELAPEHPFAETIATWIHEEWGKDDGGEYSETLARLLSCEKCPRAQVAVKDSSPIGVVGFQRHELPGKSDLQLWIDVLYVDPAFRGKNIASELVRFAEELALLYEPDLYVYTVSPSFYTRLQWSNITVTDSEEASVLHRKLEKGN